MNNTLQKRWQAHLCLAKEYSELSQEEIDQLRAREREKQGTKNDSLQEVSRDVRFLTAI